MRGSYTLILFCAFAILLWGLWGFTGKLALQRNMAPLNIFFSEVLISILISLFLFVVVTAKQSVPPLYSSWNVFGLISGAGLAFGLVFYYFALSQGQATIIVPLTACYPVVSAGLSYLLLGERPRWTQWLGIFLVVAGVVLLLSGPVAKPSNE